MNVRRAAGAALLLLGVIVSSGAASDPLATGESIYMHGMLGSGEPLVGIREADGLNLQGADAACVKCHRHSGLGSAEGFVTMPPITGEYLFHSRGGKTDQHALAFVESVHGNRDPYTDATLARAIREGIDSEGRTLSRLMPRFAMPDADIDALKTYLKSLDRATVPGVSDTLIHFATIITPDADPVKRAGMLDVMQHYFTDKNSFPFPPSPPMRASGKTMFSKSMYMANRRWQLHVWQLKGAPSTWTTQLQVFLAAEPVMAVISGLAGSNWAPVHDFCEHQHLPCLFPNVEVPDADAGDFYSVYFSKGVLLEADLIAKAIADATESRPGKTVQQIYRAGDSGEAAAHELTLDLKKEGIAVRDHILPADKVGAGVSSALRSAASADTVVLWLRPSDIAAMGEAPTAAGAVFMSGLMGGLERSPLASSWRSRAQIAYPFDLPDRRVVRVDYPLGWFSIRHIPVVAEQVQVDTYIACGLLSETLNHMADTVAREYLVERTQDMLEHRILTGYYPRLTMATGQSFGSKGGYLVKFADPTGTRLVAEGGWTVP